MPQWPCPAIAALTGRRVTPIAGAKPNAIPLKAASTSVKSQTVTFVPSTVSGGKAARSPLVGIAFSSDATNA